MRFINLASVTVLTVLAMLSTAVMADERAAAISVANQYYAAISPGHDAAMMKAKASALLSDDVVIELQDLGVTQSKSDFLESLDDWSTAISGGFVAHAVEEASDDAVAVLVCYNFGDNAIMTREKISLAARKIIKSIQMQVADDCAAF